MEEKIFGIKAFNTKDKGDVAIVGGFIILLLFATFGGGTDNTVYNAEYDISDANKYLANIDPDIKQHISSINVFDRRKVESICNRAPACAIINTINGKPIDANIYLSNNFDNTGSNFEEAFYHEVGHVEGTFKTSLSTGSSEIYADRFADQYTKKEISYIKAK